LATVRRAPLAGVVLGTVGIALAYASAFAPPPVAAWGPWLMAVALPVTMVALMMLGVVRADRRLGRLRAPIAVVLGLVTGGFLLALALPAEGPDTALWLGLPPRAAVILYGVGLLPLFILPLAYALTFEALTLSEADLARVRAARQAGATSHEGTPG
jgi:O-antigen/teichoic acid export membrane protein